jgi:hypothetical protein
VPEIDHIVTKMEEFSDGEFKMAFKRRFNKTKRIDSVF